MRAFHKPEHVRELDDRQLLTLKNVLVQNSRCVRVTRQADSNARQYLIKNVYMNIQIS